ncbi:MAG: prepilin-type N-terminal cleavage/methylation domain-containing protein [Candidatus Microsaccharimonas sp.]
MQRLIVRSLKQGFTIVELLIVIVVIGILAAVAIVGYGSIQNGAKDKTVLSDGKGVAAEVVRYMTKNGGAYNAVLDWDSSVSTNPNIDFSPSSGNIVTVGVDVYGSSYCIKVYNPVASTYNSLATAYTEGECEIRWSTLVAGSGHNCAISRGNTAYCWGDNTYGQLGNGTTTDSSVPVAVSTAGVLSGKTIKSLRLGYRHTCAIASDDKAYCWGYGTRGQLGNGSIVSSSIPVAVSTAGVLSGKTIKSLVAGFDYTCALALDSKVYCWGYGTLGQLGNGSTANSSIPVAVSTAGVLSGKTVKSLENGYNSGDTNCVIASDDMPYCWGTNSFGILGNGTTTNSSVPVAVSTSGVLSGKTIKSLDVDTETACAIASDDNLYCWGRGESGKLGNGTTTNSSVPVAVSTAGVLSGKTIKSVSVTYGHMCAIASDDNLYCWGLNNYGQLGNNSTTSSSLPVAVSTAGVLSGKTINQVVNSDYITCALASDTKVYCWGNNEYGQVGNDSTVNALVPTTVLDTGVLSGKTLKSLVYGYSVACTLGSDGNAYCWGDYSGSGELGNGSMSGSAFPVKVTNP